MRVVVQRVGQASVEVDGRTRGRIGTGLLVLAGFEDADTEQDLDWISGKILNMRIFDDENGVMNLSVQDVGGGILVVSQFTLHASTKKGNRPSYIRASKPDRAIPMYERFLHILKEKGATDIQTGEFGAYMKVALENDGPVTITMDSQMKE